MSGHTPGPWVVRVVPSGYPYTIIAPNASDEVKGAVGKQVLRWGAFMLPSSAEALANARLIASAPALLEALENLANVAGATPGFASPLFLKEARAVIAAATADPVGRDATKEPTT